MYLINANSRSHDARMRFCTDLTGGEFAAAADAARNIGSTVILGDRLVSITLQRLWGALSVFQKLRLVFYLCKSLSLLALTSCTRLDNKDPSSFFTVCTPLSIPNGDELQEMIDSLQV